MSARRQRRHPRCEHCGLTAELCVCASLPTVDLGTRLILIQHAKESRVPTNTGRLLHRMVRGSALVTYALVAGGFDDTLLRDPSLDLSVLFPRSDAKVLDPLSPAPEGRTRAFVILDGTWRQCSRMARRLPELQSLPFVKLPDAAPSSFGIRRPRDRTSLCTIEAGIRLIRMIGGEEAALTIEKAFDDWKARMLFVKGKRRSHPLPLEAEVPPSSTGPEELPEALSPRR